MEISCLQENALELIVIGLAFCFSKCKLIPFYLVLYVSFMTLLFGYNQDYIEWLYKKEYWDMYNNAVARAYLVESAVMICFAIISFINYTRMRMLTTVVMFAQGIVSGLTGMVYGVSVEFNVDLSPWFEVHYFIQGIFVILYCVIAWMCVYYSRTKNI